MLRRIGLPIYFLILLTILGCGGGAKDNPVSANLIGMSGSNDVYSGIGIMGGYTLNIDPDKQDVNLSPMRNASIGESYIVSGMGFFTTAPCADCFLLKGFSFVGGNVILTFKIRHPFEPGLTTLPPTAKNRLDLDVFDLALVVLPTSATPTSYSLMGVGIYSGVVVNADGYTRELANVINKQEALPYVLVVDDSEVTPIPTGHYNEFPMGGEENFDVEFELVPGTPIAFDLYLTMGYGASAKKAQRLTPTYYNPEFNRKAAWKVRAVATGNWVETDSTTPVDVEVRVYDWQIGANVDSTLTLQTDVYAASEVDSVSVEIPGMNSALQTVGGNTYVSGDGGPDDPLVYEVPIRNENLLAAGDYVGLVRVLDERAVGAVPPTGDRDYLIDSPDGINLNNYAMPEYMVLMPVEITVIPPPDWHGGGTWGLPAGPCTLDFGIVGNNGHAYIAHTDAVMQCTEIWEYPGWANPPAFYMSLINLDPTDPMYIPYPPTRIDASNDGALGWCNLNTNPWKMVGPAMVWNASVYSNFDKIGNFIWNPEADDHRHYMIFVPANAALFAVDCCDTFEGYQCALYVESGWGQVGFQGIAGDIPGGPANDYTDADIKWEAFFPAPLVGFNPGQVDPADVSGIDARVTIDPSTIYVYIALKANRRIEVFRILDIGPGPNDVVTFVMTIPVIVPGGPQVQPVDIELLPAHPSFIPAPNTPILCVVTDNSVAPPVPPGFGGTVIIYDALTGAPVDQIGDPVTPACNNAPRFMDTDDSEYSIHIMQAGPVLTKIDYF